MDPISLGFLLLILVASGGIAYVADGLGKKIGKKRLSVFGLRPKHVAQLGTVGMGVVVSLLTILVIAAASRDVRDWLVRGRGLLVEQKRLKHEVEELERQRTADERTRERVGQELRQAQDGLVQANASAERQRKDLATIVAKRDSLRTDVARLTGDVTRLGGELARTRLAFASSSRSLQRVQASLKDTRRQIGETRASLTATTRTLDRAKRNLVVVQRGLSAVNVMRDTTAKKSFETYQKARQLENDVLNLNSQKESLDKSLTTLQAEANALAMQRDQAQQDFDKVQSSLLAKQADLEGTQQELARLQNFSNTIFRASRTEPLTYRAGEEVARAFVPRGADREAARAALDALLHEARAEAEAKGAKRHEVKGQTLQAADLVDRKDPKTGLVIDADALRGAIVARIAGKPEDQALVATSSLNAFAGEVVSLEIVVVQNPIVYRRNEMLAETRIDGSQNEGQILAQLRQFVGKGVRDRAVQDRMIPRTGTASPFGEIPAASWFAVAQDVKRAGRPVRVQAFAGDETRAADPLRLEFRVR